ncbi:hypothetical protein [Streptomyces sp. NPDC017230]|uniref:hypothetical protein n=1 Tax=unclassified Streptomyces TaxID=2593676 RepID=UPI0037A58C77
MSESTARTGLRAGATAVVHESYSFACMRCGHGWEQSFEIEHHKAGDGHEFVLYVTDGHVVPSPLNRPTCAHCDNHVVRIMRPGRVASVRGDGSGQRHQVPPAGPPEVPVVPVAPGPTGERRHWHLADLLHALHLHRRAG